MPLLRRDCYNRAAIFDGGRPPANINFNPVFRQVNSMSEQQVEKNEDGCADVFATIAIMTIIVATVAFWLKGMV